MPSYPSIQFERKVKLPVAKPRPWRDLIGVVGEFSNGAPEVKICNPARFQEVYGFDRTNGSVAVQQAIADGATAFAISRAVPRDTPAEFTFTMSSKNQQYVAPAVGLELANANSLTPIADVEDRTIGLRLNLKYLGSPLTFRHTYGSIDTVDNDFYHPDFEDGTGTIAIHVVDYREGGAEGIFSDANEDYVLQGTIAADPAGGQYQVISIPKTNTVGVNDIDFQGPNIKPGFVFTDATIALDGLGDPILDSNGTPTLTGETIALSIISTPFDLSVTEFGVVVKNEGGAILSGTVNLRIRKPTLPRYVLGYRVNLTDGTVFRAKDANDKVFRIPLETYNDGYNVNRIDSYFIVDRDTAGQYLEFVYQTVDRNYEFNQPTLLNTESFINDKDPLNIVAGTGVYFFVGKKSGLGDALPLLKGGEFRIPLGATEIMLGSDDPNSSLAFPNGRTGLSILKELQRSVYANSVAMQLVERFDIASTTLPYQVELSTKIKGKEANRIRVQLSREVSGTVGQAEDLLIKVESTVPNLAEYGEQFKFTGGYDGPRTASRDFYTLNGEPVVRVVATNPGEVNIRVTITPFSTFSTSDTARFYVTVETQRDSGLSTQTALMDFSAIDYESGVFLGSQELSFARVLFIPAVEAAGGAVAPQLFEQLPLRRAPVLGLYDPAYDLTETSLVAAGASFVNRIPLLGGFSYDPAMPRSELIQMRKQAYLEAVKRIEEENVAFLIISGIAFGDSVYDEVFREAIDQVNRATPENGMRQLFLETPARMPANYSRILADGINNEYVTLVNGHVVQQTLNNNFVQGVGATGHYAAMMAVRPPHISAHAAGGGTFPMGVLNADTKNTPQYKNDVTLGRCDSIFFDKGLGSWKFLNGLTTSIDPTKRYNSVVRIRIQVISDLYSNLQWMLSMPNTRSLQRQVTTAVSAYMEQKFKEGWFLRIGDVICGESNNSEADMLAGRLNVELNYTPVIPADYIYVTLIEDFSLADALTFNVRPQ
jgi:hypothetical protein